MENWKLDRIITWLMSGIGINNSDSLLFLIDKKDKFLFNLVEQNSEITFRKNHLKLSKEDKINLKKLKTIYINGDSEIIKISKSGKYSELLPPEMSIPYNERETKWNSLYEEMDKYLIQNNIRVEEYKLIE